jgi:murein L,D-transpeptidase YafK
MASGMKKSLKFIVVLAAFAAGVWALAHLPDPGRWAGRVMPPDPAAHRQTALAELEVRGLKAGMPVFIRIFKQTSEMELWMKGARGWELARRIEICRWSGRLGPKLKQGDKQAPEGFYTVTAGQLNPNSRHHLSFNLGFPNRFDRAHGRTGSFLMVHGGCTSAGCYAIRDHEVEVVYRLVEAALKAGQRQVDVHAFPFRLDRDRLARHKGGKWHRFWTMLQPAYDAFERERRVPQVKVAGKTYVVK